jgi:hypothetical protein
MMTLYIYTEKLSQLGKLLDFIDNPIQTILNQRNIILIVPELVSFGFIVLILGALLFVVTYQFVRGVIFTLLLGFVIYNIGDIIGLLL